MTKTCVTCKWAGTNSTSTITITAMAESFITCMHPDAQMSRVTGRLEWRSAVYERMTGGTCGREGHLWEPREK